MTRMNRLAGLAFGLLVLAGAGHPAYAQVDQLISALTSGLGVTEDQAVGGSAAIFGLAEDRLSQDEFASLSDSVPGVGDLAAQAPDIAGAGAGGTEEATAAGSLGALTGGASESLGDLPAGLGDLDNLTALAGPFSDLGMSPDMVAEFVPVVLEYVGNTGGSSMMSLLQGALLGG